MFLTGHGDVPMAVRGDKRGAFDFLQKPVDDQRLLAVVEAALAILGDAARRRAAAGAKPPGVASLSRREREVLDLMLAGHQTRAIAEALFVTVKTVEFHRGRIHAEARRRVDGGAVPPLLCARPRAVRSSPIAPLRGDARSQRSVVARAPTLRARARMRAMRSAPPAIPGFSLVDAPRQPG